MVNYNAGSDPVVVSGWWLYDNHLGGELGDVAVMPSGYLIIAGEGFLPDSIGTAYVMESGEIGNGLANDGDRALLVDSSGRLVDALSFGDDSSVFRPPVSSASAGSSLARRLGAVDTGSAEDFQEAAPTPGRGLANLPDAEAEAPTPDAEPQPTQDVAAVEEEEDDGLGIWWVFAGLIGAGIALGGSLVGSIGQMLLDGSGGKWSGRGSDCEGDSTSVS